MKFRNVLIAAVSSIAPLLTILPSLTLPATAQQPTQYENIYGAPRGARMGDCSARVVGEEPGSRVNIRSGPGVEFNTPSNYVLVGQIVNQLTDPARPGQIRRQDDRGNTWQLVEYVPSRTRGWIRSDFLRQVGCGS